MEIALLILQSIVSMALMIIVGVVLTKGKWIPANMADYLSKIVIYVVLPSTIINAFAIEFTPQVMTNMIYAFIMALIANIILVVVPSLLAKPLHLDAIEVASIAYPNSGDILIPIVISVLSKEMQVYCCAYLVVQLCFMFTHGNALISGEKIKNPLGLLKNINVIAIIIGFCLFIFNIHLPSIVASTINSFAAMVAPLSMLVIGCAIGNAKIRAHLSNTRIYWIVFARQIISPLIFLLLIKISNVAYLINDGKAVLMIVFMATCSSSAATIANLASGYGKDVQYASMINVIGVIALILTMPLMVYCYQLWI